MSDLMLSEVSVGDELPELVHPVTPTTVVQGIVSAWIRTHFPSGSWPGHNFAAMASLTIMTLGDVALSSSMIPRPRRTRVPAVAK